MSTDGWPELMSRVQVPEKITCPTPTCGNVAVHHCTNPGGLWFYCDVCERTTWFTPKYDTGAMGRKIVRWGVRASRRTA